MRGGNHVFRGRMHAQARRETRYQPVYGVRGVFLGCGAAELSARHDRTCVGRRGDRWGGEQRENGGSLGTMLARSSGLEIPIP